MLPVAPPALRRQSSLAIEARGSRHPRRVGARTISELLRESTRIEAPPASPPPPAARAPPARRRVGQALDQRRDVGGDGVRSGITSTSPPAGTSIAAMILPMRCRLSA